MKAFLVSVLLLAGGIAQAQVAVDGNVYGGGKIGVVSQNTTVTVNGGTIGRKLTLEERKCDANGQITRINFGNVYGGGNGYQILGTDPETGAPIFSETAGAVLGNTTVTVGGDAVVRHAVYGGGNIGSVGTFDFIHDQDDAAHYTAGGKATVTIQGSAIIGPTKEDLIGPFHIAGLTAADSIKLVDSAFKYVGCNEGVVYGSSRGLSGKELRHLFFADSTIVTVTGSANVVGNVLGGGENGHVQKGTNVTVNGNSVVGGFPMHGEDLLYDDTYTITEGIYAGAIVHLKGADAELYEDEYGVGRRIFRGNVFGGGRGTDYVSYLSGNKLGFYAGRVYGNTHLTVAGNAKIYNRVYGGGTVASVGTYTYEDPEDVGHHNITGLVGNSGHAYVIITGGTIGTDGKNNGEVFGGGRGIAGAPDAQAIDEGYVGYTHVEVNGGHVKHSVYGGAANGHVLKDADVKIKETTSTPTIIGDTTWVRDGESYIVKVHGGWHGNVYGGGGGTTRYKKANGDKHLSITAGRVFGNTYVTIEGGRIWHNVYGGGAIASVGDYDTSEGATTPYKSDGYANITITGGTIGYDGNENGMVFGSGRGEIAAPGNFLDSVTYVAYSIVNIGTGTVNSAGVASGISGNAKINGSVYGGGENGHVYLKSQVNIFSGTIGCTATEYAAMSAADKLNKFPYRGNVYGSGCGTDQYISHIEHPGTPQADTTWAYNPNAGYVQGNTEVNIYGGSISHNVYGGGAMASVGYIDHTRTKSHLVAGASGPGLETYDTQNEAALSWPYELHYVDLTDHNFPSSPSNVFNGKTKINIRGGKIGTKAAFASSGDIYGSARGEAGPLFVLDTLAIVRETEIYINYATPGTNLDADNIIIGTVYGSGENGQTYENTKVTIDNAYIGGSVFGGGKGSGTYKDLLWDSANPEHYMSDSTTVRSITAGKVYGNTEVRINNGTILHNVFGGGHSASVGKGNYIGYGEKMSLSSGPADPYENSGNCTVKIYGGTIGTNGYLDTTNIYNGYVYGSSKGLAYEDVRLSPRYNYTRDFFLGYSNSTEVIIGNPDSDPEVDDGPRIYGSVFGGGENGHVRWNTNVTVNKGEIGKAYDEFDATDDTPNMAMDSMVYPGNVYGAGRGIDTIPGTGTSPGNPAKYCNSAGSVTLNTTVTVNGGRIHRNVYGGGSMATIGPPYIPTSNYNAGTSLCQVNIKGGSIGERVTPDDDDEEPFNYGGDVFGASRGVLGDQIDLSKFCNASNTQVNIDSVMHGTTPISAANVIGNVYGGGEIGQVKKEAVVNMKNGTVHGSIYGGGKGTEDEEKAALVLGNATVNMTNGTVERSIYGGGQLGSVGTFLTYDRVVYEYGNSDPTDNDTVYVPKTCTPLTGVTKVVVSGGNVGVNGSLMPWENHNVDDDDRGWIFCGCQGVADSITYYRAVALGVCDSTYLEIKNTTSSDTTYRPLITASVYGGAENGLVLRDTHVKIAGGQIGTGHYKTGNTHHFDAIYPEDKWTAAINAINNGSIETALASGALSNYFHECDAWTYAYPYLIYDILADGTEHPNNIEGNLDENTSSSTAGTNGHSFFGNVFGGGSGYYPIDTAVWRRSAGQVRGNTKVEITGGHILTAVYGGNEYTDVKGKCTVEMSDGTIGIPRTKAQIAARPVNGYLFGAGMGDPRNLLNSYNNVDSTKVEITGGTIFGGIYGGGKEGHVLDSTKVIVDGGLIGTTGLSGYDGLVFGGGRGKMLLRTVDTLGGRRKFPVGRVGGNTHVVMKNGSVLGCLYGGGQIGLVGVDETGWIDLEETYDAVHHGYAKVDITGGAIGGVIGATTENVANRSRALLQSDQKVGNVYGGGRGNINEFREDDLGRVAKSVVNVSGSPTIYGSVFGGGQMANVGYWVSYEVGYAPGTSKTQVNIQGTPKIGTEYEFSKQYANNTVTPPKWTRYDTINGMRMIIHTLTGNVYGGGQGNVKLDNHGYVVGLEHGHCGSTEVNISGNPEIMSCVFGGSEEGAVWGDTKVTISGGTIGKKDIKYDSLKYVYVEADEHWHWVHDHDSTYSFGSVFGGSYGADGYAFTASPSVNVRDSINGLSGRVYGNATVSITGGYIRGNVFGGGNMASTGEWNSGFVPVANTGKTTVSVGGGAFIGPLDGTGLNAYVFGGGKGFSHDPTGRYKTYANVNGTQVTVNGGKIKGSIFGGGSDSHVLGDAEVIVHSGADIGTNGLTTWDGNIFGGGRNFLNTNHTNGRVAGNINITMDGGTIQGSIFGGGRMALSGVNVNGEFPTSSWPVADHGNVTIKVSGRATTSGDVTTYSTVIGNDSDQGIHLLTESNESVGDIFGSGKGDTKNYMDTLAGRVTNTTITIEGSPRINGAVFGGGEMASIGWWSPTTHAYYENTGKATITIGREGQNDNPVIGTYLELDPVYLNDQFQVGETTYNHSDWTMIETVNGAKRVYHSCTGNVFGGCQGDVDFEDWDNDDSDTWNNWPYMGRSNTSTITVNGGTIIGAVFGGPEQGTMDGDATVTINGGTIGSLVTASNNDVYNFGGVYGAGYGSDDETEDNHAITVYGANTTTEMLAGRVYGNTTVDVLAGTIKGDVYGGAAFAYVGSNSVRTNGSTLVNIGKVTTTTTTTIGEDEQEVTTTTTTYSGDASFKGSVYGANNRGGTPLGDVTVNVYQTHHEGNPDTFEENGDYSELGDYYPNIPDIPIPDPLPPHYHPLDTLAWLDTLPRNRSNFAIYQVFGGSNKTDYLPEANKRATVNVFRCKENTIYEVYGGSNAASLGTTDVNTNAYVNIEGGRMYRVFGGGNGQESPADIHGSTNTVIDGGLINQVFGGSNSQGQIDEVNLTINEDGGCEEFIGDVFGGGNDAFVIGDVITTIHCEDATYGNFYGGSSLANIYGNVTVNIFGSTFNNLFAGSKGQAYQPAIGEPGDSDYQPAIEAKPANIKRFPDVLPPSEDWPTPEENLELYSVYYYMDSLYRHESLDVRGKGGNVTLNIFGGDITNAFGGSDENGNIDGKITVNVLNLGGTCDLDLTNLYGAGRETAYTPDYPVAEGEVRVSPEVNVIHGTVQGCVYGGGQGSSATTTANPVVNIGYDATKMAAIVNDLKTAHLIPEAFNPNNALAQVGSRVYGGGDYAKVIGNTTVSVTKANTTISGNVYGGGSGSDLDATYGLVQGNDTVRISGGHLSQDVFGGGETASVTGNTWVEVSGGQIGSFVEGEYIDVLKGSIYGGGQGWREAGAENLGHVGGNTYVSISGDAQIYNCVYGGGYIGSVGSANLSDNTSGVTTVKISGGKIIPLANSGGIASVFGGGQGYRTAAYKTFANVDSTSVIVCDSARIYGSVFGGSENGHVLAGTKVVMEHGPNTKDKTPLVGTNGLEGWDGHIYGGGKGISGNYTAGRVAGNTKVIMTDGTVMGCVYGGGDLALTGVDENGAPSFMVGSPAVYDSIHHGLAIVEVSGGTIGIGDTDPDVHTNALALLNSNYSIGDIFGGGSGDTDDYEDVLAGRVANAVVTVSGEPTIFCSVFGGGEMAGVGYWTEASQTYHPFLEKTGASKVTIGGKPTIGTDYEFTGEYLAAPTDWTVLDTIDLGNNKSVVKLFHTCTGNVFGGSQGDIDTEAQSWISMGRSRSTEVNINGGTIMSSVFGGAEQGTVIGDTRVNITAGTIGLENRVSDTLELVEDAYTHKAGSYSFGSVYGGGYGVDSLKVHVNDSCTGTPYLNAPKIAGRVYGNTYVNISGGTIRDNVYGGGNMASVGRWDDTDFTPVANTGKATVNISGSAIVGPLDMTGLNAYVYGGGKGLGSDPDENYKQFCNVNSTEVTVNLGESGHIYGSIFGGGADCHVLGNATVNLMAGTIGTTGLTTWDGNIFGGGRNYLHTNTTAGRVAGNITVNMTSGVLKGNLYGGGRLGSTGMKMDGSMFAGSDATHGNIFVNVKGTSVVGIAGRDTRTSGSVLGGGRGLESDTGNTLAKANNTYVNISESARIYQNVLGGAAFGSVLKDTHVTIKGDEIEIGEMIETVDPDDETVTTNHKGGYVYGGGSGYAPTGLANANAYLPYANIGIVKGDTYVTVKNGAIHGIVYGGGETASVGTYTTDAGGTTTLAPNTGATHVVVKGGYIGPLDGSGMNGYVIGGSEGVEDDENEYYKYHATVGSTNVTIDSVALVYGSVLGGGADGHVWNSTNITVQGGTIGTDGYSLGDGNVLGGGGNKAMTNLTAGRVGGNIEIAISQPVNERPTLIKGNVYGGGYAGLSGVDEHGDAYTSNLGNHGNVTIEISGGTVGNEAAIASQFVGNVFGSGKGDTSNENFGITQSTDVTVSGTARVLGNVYGGGEVADVERNTTVNIEGGTVGVLDYIYKQGHSSGDLDSIVHVNNTGNVFGGGRGNESSARVALVKGNANVNIRGGHVYFNAYGGGEKAAVGEANIITVGDVITDLTPVEGTGYTKVKVTGGQVGPAPRVEPGYNIPIGLNGLDGYVFGGGKGIGDDPISPTYPYGQHYNLANVNYACVEVNIPANADTTYHRIWGSLFGGAEDGHVLGSDTVKLVSGLVGTYGTTSYDGNIFGGGRNYHKKNYTAGRTRGNITVDMCGGQLRGTLFGGGRLAITGIDLRGNVVPDVAADPEHDIEAETFGWVKVKVSGGEVGNKKLMETFTKYSMGEVFGGGKGEMKGIAGHPAASALLISLVKNTEVIIKDSINGDYHTSPIIYGSVFGGGEVANVGEFTWNQNPSTGAISNIKLIRNGHTKVTVSGGTIGAERMRMDYTLVGTGTDKYNLNYNTDVGHVCGGGKGIVDNPNRGLDPVTGNSYYGTANVIYPDSTNAHDVSVLDVMATVNTTEVNIKDNAYVKGSVFGGSLNGHVLDSTYVLVEGGQIGAGKGTTSDLQYTDLSQFVDPADPNTEIETSMAPTDHWEYGKNYTINGTQVKKYYPFDPVLVYNDTIPSDGKTWFGNVYGGGSGYYPYIIVSPTTGNDSTVWNRNSGMVRGNTRVEITGGHVLSCVYGGCETTDVLGHATVILNGSDASHKNKLTVGVPRVEDDIRALPLPGYVYGSGNGDPRTNFNTWTNVDSTYVKFNNGIVYGCVFGGGMDGHVLRHTHVEVLGGTIGTFGTTGAEGNVFGGGRGSNPVALTAGGVGGNTQVDIKDGRMFGSIFGGGNNGSVGIDFLDPTSEHYGDTVAGLNHGYTVVNISGGTIGHDDTGGRTGGNVYGACRGTAGAPGTISQRMAKVKGTQVNIWEAEGKHTFIMGSVFGSGEDGHVLKDTYVTVSGGQIGGKGYVDDMDDIELCEDVFHGNVYGGGRGLDKYTDGSGVQHYSITAGKVSGNSNVLITGGRITRNVYGGGNVASVGEYVTQPSSEDPTQNVTVPKPNTGTATVCILGGTIGKAGNSNRDYGNVFGSSHGVAGTQYKDLAYVHYTLVEVDSVAVVNGSVFGGGDDGHVNKNTEVNVCGGTIGFPGIHSDFNTYMYQGNVYGGGRGLDKDENEQYSPTAGEVYGKAVVNIKQSERTDDEDNHYTPTIWHNVYGGGSASVVHVSKKINVSAGVIKANVFGGSRHLPEERENKAPRCVNMWGGTVGTLNSSGNLVSGTGNVYGCSYQGIDGDPTTGHEKDWASFVNMSGGTVLGSVYGAGYQGNVKGSVGVLIGKNAIVNAPTEVRDADSLKSVPAELTNALDIKGDVYAGSNFFGGTSPISWREFDVTGYSNIYIDGEGYKTGPTTTGPEMYIRGGLFGSGTNCEAGAEGRNIVLRMYGEREMYTHPSGGGKDITNDSVQSVSRTLTTIQRVSDLVIDGANIALTGARDLSNLDGVSTLYGIYQVDTAFWMCNGSSIVLGNDANPANIIPANIDSVRLMRSLKLNESVYNKFKLKELTRTWIGVLDSPSGRYTDPPGLDANLYYYGDDTHHVLNRKTEENVILFKGMSQLYVRYHIGSDNSYGELQGFFRMSSSFKPHGSESFAYARPKVTSAGKDEVVNTSDGGFLSYHSPYNFFTDDGAAYTKTKQYPYTNVLVDPVLGECRGWYIPEFNGHKWYVDGRLKGTDAGGWGSNAETAASGQGRYPDKPKLTIVGGDNPSTSTYSIMGDNTLGANSFNSETDIIYVVGPISAVKELAGGTSCILKPNASHSTLPLRIYRYPGGHKMSTSTNEITYYDYGPSGTTGTTKGPGPYYGSLLVLDNEGANSIVGDTLVLDSVYIDGLYNVTDPGEAGSHEINTNVPVAYHYDGSKAEAPLVMVNKGKLLMKDHTELTRGYNKNDASGNLVSSGTAYYNFFRNPDFDNRVINGGGLYVANDDDAVVKVEGYVTITNNKQKNGLGTIPCNVYLPNFFKYIEISDALDEETSIGVTSPNRNTSSSYHANTLSPVAKGVNTGQTNVSTTSEPMMVSNAILDAKAAWINCNFLDDQGWFFASGNKTTDPVSPRTTYYDGSGTKNRDNTTLYFGWTWASVVRTVPDDYSNTNIDSPEDLAWLITAVPNATIKQTADLDMGQYVWVPIGSNSHHFAGTYDGQGHLIKNLYIDYIGTGDLRYERTNYGLFGNVDDGTIDRTFVVSGEYQPYVSDLNGNAGKNIGGLVGYMEGTSVVSNSEAAVLIQGPNHDDDVIGNVLGGLVAKMIAGEVHSSMTMSTLSIGQNYKGDLGGLVGYATGGAINNSFANGTFSINNNTVFRAGGLVGVNTTALIKNCYVTWHDSYTALTSSNFGTLAYSNSTTNNIQYCYARKNTTGESFGYTVSGYVDTETCKPYLPVYSADMLGYMYDDNKIEGNTEMDTAMFVTMNRWVTNANGTGHKYAQWARPGLQEINGDLPVLLLSEFDGTKDHQGGFRSLSTYDGGPALQYGGPVRDTIIGQALNTWSPQLDGALTRATAGNSIFIYGDVVCAPTVAVSATKVSVYEHASILSPGSLVTKAGGSKVEYDDTYVGITFDNSKKNATATYGVNYGLGGGNAYFTRDWHMFSTPLSSAPLGFDYKGDNVEGSSHYNNPWVNQSMEFNWLNNGTGGNIRYWMKGWTDSQGPNTPSSFVEAQWVDGYFPSSLSSQQEFGTGCVEGTDEYGRYPYGMDFYTWTEPDYHWINFKRNGPNHWHSDGDHKRIDYEPVKDADVRVNEENLIVGRGYMASISMQTFLQSHGKLNAGNQSIALTKTAKSKVPGWNLVGNPYHGYIDFDKLALNNGEVLDIRNSQKFYVVYDADGYGHGGNMEAGSAFLYYAVGGSMGGEYADRYIHPHQGFYVLAKDGGGNLQFTESMLVGRDGITSSFRDEEQPAYPLVNLYLSSDNGCNDVTVIELERPEWGGAKKIRELRNGNGLFYAQHDNTHYAALFAVVGTERVPLWFEAKEDDIYTIKWNTANGDFHSMYLIDNKLGVQYDMLRNDTYSFEGHVGDYPSRFYIVFNVTDVDEHLEGNGFVFFDDSQWIVTGEGDLEFIDVQGQVLVRTHVGGGQSRITVPDVAPGVYLFRLSNSEGTRVQKVIVKR